MLFVLDNRSLDVQPPNPLFTKAYGYIPLEEEVQAGCDVYGGENDIPGAINCLRCGEMVIPKLGCRTLSIGAALAVAMH